MLEGSDKAEIVQGRFRAENSVVSGICRRSFRREAVRRVRGGLSAFRRFRRHDVHIRTLNADKGASAHRGFHQSARGGFGIGAADRAQGDAEGAGQSALRRQGCAGGEFMFPERLFHSVGQSEVFGAIPVAGGESGEKGGNIHIVMHTMFIDPVYCGSIAFYRARSIPARNALHGRHGIS